MVEETINGRVKRQLQAAADDVIREFTDEVLRSCDVEAKSNLQWEVNFVYTLPWGGLQPVPSLIIDDAYPIVPDHDLLKEKIRAHLLTNPPKLASL